MAGIAVSVMKPVLAKLGMLMCDEYKKLKGLRDEVSFLKLELSDMAALLEKMDNADELDPQAKHWREDILEMSYDIEDYIDQFMDCVGETQDKVGILQKASHFLRTIVDRYHLANDFKKMKSQVIEASKRRKRYMLDQCISNTSRVVVDPRLSALYNESASLVGIEDQKQELVNWVLDKEQQLKVVSIVGFGGLGKTTLANEVYREVGSQFNCKAFVSVSSKPDMIRLLKSILSQLEEESKKTSHVSEINLIINNIRMCLQDKRYFVVIDDLWDIQAWNIISCNFHLQNDQYSRVIITTRNEEVARLCSRDHRYIHKMKPLNEQDSKKLFYNRIFDSDDHYPSPFEELSRSILKKCSGLPLAIVTVASILACQPTPLMKEQWESIQNSLTSISATKSLLEDMMNILELSYKSLPNSLKPCFLYLGTYPEDYKIRKDELIRRWVAEGFVSNSPGRDVWAVAESYFNELVNRSMIQPAHDDNDNTGVYMLHCRVHDMMLELILRKCREDNFLRSVNDPRMLREGQDKAIRRLTMNLNGVEYGTMATTSHQSKVRSLSIFCGSSWIPLLQEFKSVRVLFLDVTAAGHMETTALTVINRLSQLRYLNVRYNALDSFCNVLLDQIGSLRHLETLDLSHLRRARIPPDIVDLPRLSHLDVGRGCLGLPEGICKMKSLHTLNGFTLMNSSLENIGRLGHLTNLTELSIEIEFSTTEFSIKGAMAALSSSLEKLSNLKCFVVEYSHTAVLADALISSRVAASFSGLERLHLEGWIFSRFPRWIGDLHNLRDLWLLVKQIGEGDIGVIGMLPFLVKLHVGIPGAPTERIVIGGSTGFRFLKVFIFDCDKTSLLTFDAGAMPSLVSLRLRFFGLRWDKGTPVGLPHLSSLKVIDLWVSPLTSRDMQAFIRNIFRKAADELPGRPAITMSRSFLFRAELPDEL